MSDPQKTRLEIFNLKVDIGLKMLAVVAIGCLFVFREQVMDTLADAGVNKIKVPFFEVEIAADDAEVVNDRLKEVLDQVALQETRIETLTELIRCQRTGPCTDNQQSEIAALVGAPEDETPLTAAIAQNLQDAVLVTDQIIQSKGLSDRVAGGEWVIIVGADKTLDSAEWERMRLERGGFEGRIARKGSWLRTYAPFPSKEAASEASSRIQALLDRRKVYVVEFTTWCPDAAPADDGIMTCG